MPHIKTITSLTTDVIAFMVLIYHFTLASNYPNSIQYTSPLFTLNLILLPS